jgi:hypothetical protein
MQGDLLYTPDNCTNIYRGMASAISFISLFIVPREAFDLIPRFLHGVLFSGTVAAQLLCLY